MVSKKLKAWRTKKGISLEQAASEIGCSASHLWRLENGAEIRTVTTAKKIATAIGVTDYRRLLS